MKTLIIANIIVTLVCWYSIMHNIGKHSVHPTYGNVHYVDYKCQPWDSCP